MIGYLMSSEEQEGPDRKNSLSGRVRMLIRKKRNISKHEKKSEQ